MVNDIYQFPTTPENAPKAANTLEYSSGTISEPSYSERVRDSGERLKPYGLIVEMGEQIRSYREAALEEERLRNER